MLGLLFVLLIFQQDDLYNQSMENLYSGNTEQAYMLMKRGMEEVGSERFLFGLAWIEFTQENYEESKRLLNHILEGNPKSNRAGASYYTLGLVCSRQNLTNEAFRYFDRAVEIFKDQNGTKNQLLKTYFAMAELHLSSSGNVRESEKYLLLVFSELEKSNLHPGDFYYLRAKVEFERGNFLGAYNYGVRSNEAFHDEQTSKEIISILNLSIYATALGKLQEGRKRLSSARKIQAKGDGFIRLNRWFELVEAFVAKCETGQFVLKNAYPNDPDYTKLFNFVNQFECQ